VFGSNNAGSYLTDYLHYPKDPISTANHSSVSHPGGMPHHAEQGWVDMLLGSIGLSSGTAVGGHAPEMSIWELNLWHEVRRAIPTYRVH
jgi:hypothetical protein